MISLKKESPRRKKVAEAYAKNLLRELKIKGMVMQRLHKERNEKES